jgi:RNA polymerase sigma-70 factor (ECF subfamily)
MNETKATYEESLDAIRHALEAWKSGERSAFSVIFRTYFPRCHRLAWALLGNRDEALDVTQNAFIKVYRARDRVDSSRPLFPWLRAIVVSECRMHNRSAQRRRQRTEVLARQPESWIKPHRSHVDSDDAVLVRHALDQLPAEDRELIVLKHLEGLSYADIGEILGIPAGTVMSRLFHARRRLREALVRLGVGDVK